MAEERFQAMEQQLRWIGALFEQNLPILKQQVAALRVNFRALRADLEASDLEEENGKPIMMLSTEGEGFKSSVLEEETESEVAARIVEHATEDTRNARLPSSPLPSSPEVMVQETLSQVAAVPSSLSLQAERDSCDLAAKTNARGVVWQLPIISEPKSLGLTSTGMNKIEFEKSNLQLSSICSQDQKSFEGVQLADHFSGWQGYFDDPLDFLIPDEYMGLVFPEKGPKSLEWVISMKPTNLSLNWISPMQFSPTQSLLLVWFRGKLIAMLYGRTCSLSRKKMLKV